MGYYRLCWEGFLNVPPGVQLRAILATYNLWYWFDGKRGIVYASNPHIDGDAIIRVDTSGWAEVYQLRCSAHDYPAIAARLLGLNETLDEFYAKAASDPLLSGFASTMRGWRLRKSSLWWSLVIGVCQQNASFRQGWRMVARIVGLYGRTARLTSGEEVALPPTPADVLARPELLKEAGLGYRARTLVEAAKKIAEGLRLPSNPYEAERVLRAVKGIGSYTARLALVLTGHTYQLPPVDRWLRRLASEAYGVEEKEVEDYWAERWGSWAGLAAVAVTIAFDAAPLRKALQRLRRGENTPGLDEPSPLTLWRYRY